MITPLPTPPSRADSANFADRADAFLGALPTFATEANTTASDVNSASASASASASSAAAYSAAASAVASYKGEWSSLTGVMNVPASVSHLGEIWILASNVSTIQSHAPGVSSVWIKANQGALELVAVINVSSPTSQVNFSNVFSSKYDNYLVLIDNLALSSSSSAIFVRVETGGVFSASEIYVHNPGVLNTAYSSLTNYGLLSGALSNTLVAGGLKAANLEVSFRNVNSGVNPTLIQSKGSLGSAVTVNGYEQVEFDCSTTFAASAIVTGFQVFTSVSMSSGKFKVYGYKKA